MKTFEERQAQVESGLITPTEAKLEELRDQVAVGLITAEEAENAAKLLTH